LILTALRLETRAVARALGLRTREKGLSAKGTVGDIEVELMTVGLRAARLPAVVPNDVKFIIMAGLGGGLDPSLRVGDVVTGDGIHTSAEAALTPERKAELFCRTGARVVDMETAIVRRWAEAAGVPFIAIRAVSDAADEAIDPGVLALVDEVGRPRAFAVARYLLSRPSGIRRLLRLGAASRAAGERLGEAVREIITAPDRRLKPPLRDASGTTR
jgi:nucleoside phosphorylase